jgi:hypothetical protein
MTNPSDVLRLSLRGHVAAFGAWLLLAAGRIVGKRADIFIPLRYWTNAA